MNQRLTIPKSGNRHQQKQQRVCEVWRKGFPVCPSPTSILVTWCFFEQDGPPHGRPSKSESFPSPRNGFAGQKNQTDGRVQSRRQVIRGFCFRETTILRMFYISPSISFSRGVSLSCKSFSPFPSILHRALSIIYTHIVIYWCPTPHTAPLH